MERVVGYLPTKHTNTGKRMILGGCEIEAKQDVRLEPKSPRGTQHYQLYHQHKTEHQ